VSGLQDHFSAIAAEYRAARPRWPGAVAEFLAATAPGRALAWEAGCGSGQFTEALARAFARVHASDASAAQLAAADPRPGVRFAAEPAERCSLPIACADLVCAAQAAHWFDLPRFYAEARRVARPGAAIALLCYSRCAIAPEADGVVEAFHSGAAGPHWPPERRHVEDGYRSLPFPFPELAAPAFALEADWNLSQFLGYVATWSAAQRLRAAAGPAPFEEFARALARAWGDPAAARRVTWPLGLRLGRMGG
jgi:SAM-dependent methyltransferase